MNVDLHTRDSQSDEDSVEEVITVRPIPIPAPRLPTYSFTGVTTTGVWSDRSENDSGLPTMRRESNSHTTQTVVTPIKEKQPIVLGFPPIIPLNVGGQLYMTRLSTLLKYSDSMLAAMFSGRHQVDRDRDGNYFLDSNGVIFGHILEYLRYGTLPPKDHTFLVFRDANYYGLHDLVETLQLKPEIASISVKESQRAQFPYYGAVKEEIVKVAMSRAVVSRIGDVHVHAFRKEFKPKTSSFNPKHGCIIDNAQVKVGPWEGPADEDAFIRCIEYDLQEEGFTLRPHEGKKKCKYYFGQTCQNSIFKITILFD